MEQYSNLNVHGKIKQLTTQSGRTPEDAEVVRYDTLTDRVPTPLPTAPTSAEAGKAIVVNSAGNGLEYGEAGKVDGVKLGDSSATAVTVTNKYAIIPKATNNGLGVVQTGTGITNNSGTISVTYGNTAGTACEGNDSRLSDARTPLSHTHGNITNDGKLGTTANKPVVTTTGGVIVAGSVTSPIAMSGTSIIHETSGPASTGNTLSKGSASKSVSVTVNEWGHVTALSDQDIAIAESQVTNLSTDLSTITGNISTINGKIPSAASSSNQLADKDFVNSSIGTATANFLGTYNAVSDLGNSQATVDTWSGSEDTAAQTLVAGQISSHLPSGTTVTKNDYVFVAVDQTPTGDAGEDWFWRFKYTGSAWAYEYTLNNSSFTADQWNTINSLVTNTSSPKVGVDVKDINAHLADTTIHVTASDKTTWNGKQNAITGAASSITSSNLTASRVLVSDANGKVAASSSVTTTELGYIDGVTENIQTQLDTKFDTIAQDSTGNYVTSVAVDSTDPSTLNVTRATLPTLSKGTTTGSGNVVSDISVSGHTITLTKGVTALTSHQTIKQDGITGATANRYAVCSTAASTAAKTASVTSGTFSLETGARVTVKFNNANTATTSPTLNINSTGAKSILHKGATFVDDPSDAGGISLLSGVCDFVYDGSAWNLIGDDDGKVRIHEGAIPSTRNILLAPTFGGNGDYNGGVCSDFSLQFDGTYLSVLDLNSYSQDHLYDTTKISPNYIMILSANSSEDPLVIDRYNGITSPNGFTGNLTGTASNVPWSGINDNPIAATNVTLADM